MSHQKHLSRLQAHHITTGYHKHAVSEHLSISIPEGKFTAIIGPNGCGKSTLLHTLSRLQAPLEGELTLDNIPFTEYKSKQFAQIVGLLPQSNLTPEGVRVFDLVSRGRYPHQSFLNQWSQDDQDAVELALKLTHLEDIQHAYVHELSGGQRQRVWIALLLSQKSDILFLDEPTTYLDIAHQLDVLNIFANLKITAGKTVVAVLHDINQACRFADHLVVMKQGQIVATGAPKTVVTTDLLQDVFAIKTQIISDPIFDTPLIVPF
jgi:iron complex transport system ATP-binding protein